MSITQRIYHFLCVDERKEGLENGLKKINQLGDNYCNSLVFLNGPSNSWFYWLQHRLNISFHSLSRFQKLYLKGFEMVHFSKYTQETQLVFREDID